MIRLNSRDTFAQMLAALAHELGHAIASDYGQRANHARADEYGAALLISEREYAEAERLVGEHPGALAAHLGVTRRLILAWRRWYVRTHEPVAVDAD